MANGFKVDMAGLISLEKRIAKVDTNLKQFIGVQALGEMQQAATEAKRASPIDTGRLRNSINAFTDKGQVGIVAQTDYAAYHDFGTITRVSVPSGLEGIATQFKGKGLKVNGGINPRPYLYPAFFRAIDRIKQRISKILDK